MEFVSWDDEIPNLWKVIKFMFSHHQPDWVSLKIVYPRSSSCSPFHKRSIDITHMLHVWYIYLHLVDF